MMNFNPQSVEQYHSDADRIGARTEDDFKSSTFSEVHSSVRDMMLNEGLSTSESRLLTPKLDEQLILLNDLTGQYPGAIQENTLHGFSRDYKEQLLDQNQDLIRKLRDENPESGLLTFDDILNQTKAETKLTRQKAIRSMLQADGMTNLGMVTGTMRAVLEDPIIIGSMVVSGLVTKGKGTTAAARAMSVAKTEAMIGSISEAMIQPSVYGWKQRLESPYSLQEAAFNVMIAGGLGAILGAGGSLVYDAATFRKAAKLKNVKPDEAEILNRYADELDTKPDDVDLKQHFDAVDKVSQDIDEGIKPDISTVVEKKAPIEGDTVKMDGVSARAMADIALQKELNDLPEMLKRQSGTGFEDTYELGEGLPEMLRRQSEGDVDVEPPRAAVKDILSPEDDIPGETKIINDQMQALRQKDFDVPVEQVLDDEGETKIITRKASELFDEIEADEKSIDDIVNCYGGAK